MIFASRGPVSMIFASRGPGVMIFASSITLPNEVNDFSLLINCLLPVQVYIHGTSSPLPNLCRDYALQSVLLQNC